MKEKETKIIWVDGEPLIDMEDRRPMVGFQVIQMPMDPFRAMMEDMMSFMKNMGLDDADKKRQKKEK